MLDVVRKAKFEGKRKEKPVRENSLSMSGEKRQRREEWRG